MIRPAFPILTILIFLFFSSYAQVRNGWRSVYDKYGRLSRMNYFMDGVNVVDSNYYFQYHTDFILKGLVTGEISTDNGCKNGSVSLYDYSGILTSYYVKKNSSKVYDVNCQEYGKCFSSWIDLFDSNTGDWLCDSISVENDNLIIHNSESMCVALYSPEIGYNLNRNFSLRLIVPTVGNSAKQGIALGWADEKNYFLFEFLFGKYYSIQTCKDGIITQLTSGRKEIEHLEDGFNEVIFKQNDKNLIVQINGNIEEVIPINDYAANQIALISRSKGNAMFGEFMFNYELQPDDEFYSKFWVGKGTGFYISTEGKILTTYDVVADAKSLRVKGIKNGVVYILPAKVIRTEEENNLAVLQVTDPDFSPFDVLPFGYTDHIPASNSKAYAIGYPNAIGGIFMQPEVFNGEILPISTSTSGVRVLQMDFRNGMIGAPVFDFNFNLLGICSSKGIEMKNSEMVDFFSNSRLLIANMGKAERRIVSPFNEKTYQEKYRIGSELVVLIESSVFDLQTNE